MIQRLRIYECETFNDSKICYIVAENSQEALKYYFEINKFYPDKIENIVRENEHVIFEHSNVICKILEELEENKDNFKRNIIQSGEFNINAFLGGLQCSIDILKNIYKEKNYVKKNL